MKNLSDAIRVAIEDYNWCPNAYHSLEDAIKYRVAEFVWIEIKSINMSKTCEVLEIIKRITD